MSLFGNKTTSHLGIDIGAHGMKLVELKKTKGRPQLWTYGLMSEPIDIHADAVAKTNEKEASVPETPRMPLPPGASPAPEKKEAPEPEPPIDQARVQHYAERLRALLKEAKVSGKTATASLPVSQVFHTAITLPLVDKKEIDHHVRAKVTKMLPLPIERMQVVHQLIPQPVGTTDAAKKKEDYLRILVTAAPKQLVAFYTEIFQQAGLALDELETEAFALQRALIGTDQSTSMIIDMGAERTNFFVIDQTIPITHRSLQVGGNAFDAHLAEILGVEPVLAAQMKHDFAHVPEGKISVDAFHALIDPIVKEIQYNIELFSSQTGNEQKRLEKIVFSGGSSLFPPIVEAIRRAFPVNVFIGDPWARVVYQQGLKRVLDDIGPRMAVSIGLALRNIV